MVFSLLWVQGPDLNRRRSVKGTVRRTVLVLGCKMREHFGNKEKHKAFYTAGGGSGLSFLRKAALRGAEKVKSGAGEGFFA